MLQDIDTVIFDLDGTLADSMSVWDDIDEQFFRERQLTIPASFQKDIEGMSFSEVAAYFVKTFHLTESPEDLKKLWNAQARDAYLNQVALKTGVRTFLEAMKERGIRMGIATSNSRELLEGFLTANQLSDYFHATVTSCDVAAGKPAPDVYLKTADLLGAKPEHCLVFEDVPMGILAGKNAKMRVCAVEDSYSANMLEEKKELADYYIKTYYDVLASSYEVL